MNALTLLVDAANAESDAVTKQEAPSAIEAGNKKRTKRVTKMLTEDKAIANGGVVPAATPSAFLAAERKSAMAPRTKSVVFGD